MNHLASFGLVIALGMGLSACAPEEYGACSIPNTTAHQTACRPTASGAATCTADYVFDCDSLICGIYNGSDPFCTRRCVPTATECNASNPEFCECPAGRDCVTTCPQQAACVEWIRGRSEYFCLPRETQFPSGN
ncbi:MAG: hypothetical protein FWC40_06635 [Proteobacteria bacterium]|nr:hypothetical protein [Pseudomonadota bacterium]